MISAFLLRQPYFDNFFTWHSCTTRLISWTRWCRFDYYCNNHFCIIVSLFIGCYEVELQLEDDICKCKQDYFFFASIVQKRSNFTEQKLTSINFFFQALANMYAIKFQCCFVSTNAKKLRTYAQYLNINESLINSKSRTCKSTSYATSKWFFKP